MDAALSDTSTTPQVVSITPLAGAVDVPVEVVPVAFTDQTIMTSGGGMALLDGAISQPGTVVLDPAAMGIAFVSDTQLAPNHHFVVTISTAVTNLAGEPLGPYSWSFDTGADAVPPHLASEAPAEHATEVPVTTGIRVTFDEPVTGVDATSFTALDGGTHVVGTVAMIGPRTYELRPVSSLSHGSTITVALSDAIVDTYGNAMWLISYSFTTAP